MSSLLACRTYKRVVLQSACVRACMGRGYVPKRVLLEAPKPEARYSKPTSSRAHANPCEPAQEHHRACSLEPRASRLVQASEGGGESRGGGSGTSACAVSRPGGERHVGAICQACHSWELGRFEARPRRRRELPGPPSLSPSPSPPKGETATVGEMCGARSALLSMSVRAGVPDFFAVGRCASTNMY